MTRVIALHGYAGVGKDTLGKVLSICHGYHRVAFADRLKAVLLAMDPVVHVDSDTADEYRLATLIHHLGWDDAKWLFPEVRDLLQRVGEAARENIGPKVWIEPILADINRHELVVVTDLRMANELEAIKNAGFGEVTSVHLTRDGIGPASDHISEHPMVCDITFDLSPYPLALMVDAASDLLGLIESYTRQQSRLAGMSEGQKSIYSFLAGEAS